MKKQVEFRLKISKDIDAYIQKNYPKVKYYQILQKSLDARKANLGKEPTYLCKVEFLDHPPKPLDFTPQKVISKQDFLPIIIGAGPAGLFCALRLKDYGIKSIVLERGERSQKRMLSIAKFWRKGELNEDSNVCFGEGGAGLFSDGKIYTRVKSPYVKYVLNKFIDYGASEDIQYISNPHLGSHKIRKMIQSMTQDLLDFGSVVRFDSQVDDINLSDSNYSVTLKNGDKLQSKTVVLATGHSAKEFHYKLFKRGLEVKPKDFAVGFRIEHPRDYIDHLQFGKFSKSLGAATYRLKYHDKQKDRASFSFCMCPGGYVLSSGTEKMGLVTNGMSNDSHNSRWSNSAIVTQVKSSEFSDCHDHPFSGFDFISDIEKKAFQASIDYASGRELPAITLGEYLKGEVNDSDLPKTSSPSKIFKYDISKLFPDFINDSLKHSIIEIDKKLKGFLLDEAILIAPETRTSSPITIMRDRDSLESISYKGFYPCGEGAGYAGGITSAAVDGINVADKIAMNYLIN